MTGEARSVPHPGAVQFPGRGNLSVAGFCRVHGVCLVVSEYDEALPRGVVGPDTRVVGVVEPVVRGVEEPPEHHWVRHAGEVPLCIPVRGGGWQLAGGAVRRLVVGGSARVPDRWDVADRTSPARRRVGVGGGDVRHRGATQTDGEAWPRNREFPRRSGCRLAGGRVVSGTALGVPFNNWGIPT
jgi:hypothetical protein